MALTKIPSSLLDTSGGFDLQGNITLGANEEVQFGDASELKIFNDGTNSVLRSSDNLLIQRGTTPRSAITITDSTGEVALAYGGSTVFQTSSTGATVTGNLAVTGDLDITGNVNSASVTDLDVTDKTITLGAGQTEALSGGSGIIIDGSSASILWDETNSEFDINNNINVTGTAQATRLGLGNAPHATAPLHITTTNQHIRLNNGSELAAISVLSTGELDIWGHGDGETINFRTGSGTGTVGMNVVGTNVGIGTDSPDADLEVRTTQSMVFTSDTVNSITLGTSGTNKPCIKFDTANTTHTNRVWAIENGAGDRLNFFRNGLDILKLNQDGSVEIPGSVGIGTSSPGVALDLETAGNTADGTYYSTFTINNTGSSTWSRIRFDRSGVAKWGISLGTDDKFKISNLFTGGTTADPDDAAFVIDNDSDIGIGTASPTGSLHIHRDSDENSPEIRITTGKDSGTPTAQISYSAGSGYFLRLPDAANNEDVMIRSYGDTVFHGGSVSIGDQLKVGSFTNGQTNTGEAWLGRASDRNQGTLTVQLGGGTTGRKFEIVDHDWQKVLMQIDGNAEGGSLVIPATEGGSAGNTGIIMRNRHPGNAEPYTSLDVRELQTTNSYGGIGMYSNLQTHLRFKTGGGSTTWDNGTGHQWQLRMGNGAAEDQMEFYAWTGAKRVHRMYGSNGAHTMAYQLGARLGLPSNQTISTSWVDLNFSDTNSTYFMYNQGLTLSSGTITVPVAGRYAISGRFRTEATPFQAPSQIAIYIDNSGSGSGTFVQAVRLYITSNTQSSYEHAPPLDGIFNLVAGARFVVRAISGSGNYVFSSTSNTVNHLSVMKLA